MTMFQILHRMMSGAATLNITCEGCGHEATWTCAQALKRLGPDATPFDVRRKLRCSGCGRAGRARTWIGRMNKLHPKATLERPAERLLKGFKINQVGNDTVRSYLHQGFSLAICCRDCPRLIEWTPPDLERLFAGHLELRIADLASRLSCTGESDCGAKDVAVFPHLYDLPWRWTPPAPWQPD